ncbi:MULTISPECIES: L-sulfolactate dehydrogenase [Methanobacterium]|uniref:Sulfolactate dehydrogenase n=1 Tax=Methanobacterium bryantii TaxID=2161 RepID=A0A2A2H736_METBR|nr:MULTISPECIES: L-sulfolactate dehydrogenase [Methanobacterium]OEC84757.1 sulfolactate dehydrogenase [Methanobacterium sp. A39]PAV05063.1 sulfolactate dehydrogenase [Methanobacterium bryantii]
MKITIEQERSIIMEILTRFNIPEEDAYIVADVTMDADLKGFTSHGIGRFPQYVKGLKVGTIDPEAEITVEAETASTALLNGNHKFGHVVTYKGMEMAMKKAEQTGVGLVGVHNSNHFGVAGYYSDMAVMQDMIGVVIANTEPAVAPIGGKEPIIGTNPIAIGIPANKNYVSVDMATSASARGKLLEAFRKGQKIPENVALDCDGNPTTDPEAALKGSILPFGAHKGYALAFMVEIMAGPLVRAAFGKGVKGTANPEEMCTKGDLLMAINPSKFSDINQFKEEVDEFVAEIKDSGENIFIPGDMEVNNIKRFREEGFSIDDTLFNQLKEIADELAFDLDEILKD